MPALIAAQTFPQCPVDDRQFASAIVVKQIAGMRVAVKNRIFRRRQKWDCDQGFDELFGNFPAPGHWQSSRRVRHLDSALLRERRNSGRTQRLNQPRDAHPLHRSVQAPCFDQRLLLPDKVDLVPEQAPDFLESIGEQLRGKSVIVLPVAEVLRQPLQIVHVFREILGDVRLQNFENSSLPLSALRATPGKAHHCADTGLRENRRRDLHVVFINSRAQLSSDDRDHILGPDIANSIFQPLQCIPQRRTKMLIARNDLPEFLQTGHFRNQPQQAHFRRSIHRKLKLLEQFGSKARRRKPRYHEHHRVPNRRTPLDVSLRY